MLKQRSSFLKLKCIQRITYKTGVAIVGKVLVNKLPWHRPEDPDVKTERLRSTQEEQNLIFVTIQSGTPGHSFKQAQQRHFCSFPVLPRLAPQLQAPGALLSLLPQLRKHHHLHRISLEPITISETRSARDFTWSCPSRARASSCSISPTWLVALATSALSRSRSASSCSMCCCFSFRASWRAVVPEIFLA